MSDPATVAQAFQAISLQTAPFEGMLLPATYLMGATFGMQAMMKLMAYKASDGRLPLSPAVISMVLSTILLSSAYFMDSFDSQQAQARAASAAAPRTEAPKTVEAAGPKSESAAPVVKEPAYGASGDLHALLEILGLFAAVGLGGFYAMSKAAKRTEARRAQVRESMVDWTAIAEPPSIPGGAVWRPEAQEEKNRTTNEEKACRIQ